MALMHVLVFAALCALVLSCARRIPLTGWRKWLATSSRIVEIFALCAALWAGPHRQTHEVPRYVIYLVDGSASIDAQQRAWEARRIASLDALRPRQLERAVITFGADTQVVVPFGHDPLTQPEVIQRTLERASIHRDHTNLEAGLLGALALAPPDHHGAVVLLTDGRETHGNVSALLSYLHRLGLEIFSVPTPVMGAVKTVWEELAVSPVVQRGSPVALQLVVFNGSSQMKRGEVSAALEGVTIKRHAVAIRPGWQVLTLAVPALERGTMALDVRLAIPSDGLTEQRRAYTEVEGPPQVLFVGNQVTALPALAMALKRRDIEVAVATPTDLPSVAATDSDAKSTSAVSKAMDDDAVLLFNVPKSSLSAGQVEALRQYIEESGGGLITVGLGGDLAMETTTPAPLDALLPIHFEPKGLHEAKRRVCMVMLIDRSASMIGPRIAATKRAAVELVKQLAPEDLVGVLAFDTKPYIVAEVEPAGQLAPRLVDKLVKLRSSGGTDIYPALLAASSRLEMTDATLKHIILLSDGYTPWMPEAYKLLTEQLKLNGTTVSTIGIGATFINTDYLEWLARSTGGTFYQMRTLDELPQLIARDTHQAIDRLPFTEGYFKPTRSPSSDWFADIVEWPSLRGYLTASTKPAARTDLTVNGGEGEEPLLARWTVGAGRVVSFTSDADTRWAPDWIRWPRYEGLWAQVVRWAMRPRFTEELFVWVDEHRGDPELVLEGTLRDPKAKLSAAEGGAAIPISLVQTGTWRWRASLEQVSSGWYELTVESHLPATSGTAQATTSSTPVFAKRWVQIGTPPSADETPNQPPREALLRQLAAATGGTYDVPDRALTPPTTTTTTSEPMLGWWLPLAILVLLLDVALRGASML